MKLVILITIMMILPMTSAFEVCVNGFGICNPELPQMNPDTTTGTSTTTNYSLVNVNNSQYLQGYNSSDFWKSFQSQVGLTGDKNGTYNLYTTGQVIFDNLYLTNNLFDEQGRIFIDMNDYILRDPVTTSSSLLFQERLLTNNLSQSTLDWGNKNLIGNWTENGVALCLANGSNCPSSSGSMNYTNIFLTNQSNNVSIGRTNFTNGNLTNINRLCNNTGTCFTLTELNATSSSTGGSMNYTNIAMLNQSNNFRTNNQTNISRIQFSNNAWMGNLGNAQAPTKVGFTGGGIYFNGTGISPLYYDSELRGTNALYQFVGQPDSTFDISAWGGSLALGTFNIDSLYLLGSLDVSNNISVTGTGRILTKLEVGNTDASFPSTLWDKSPDVLNYCSGTLSACSSMYANPPCSNISGCEWGSCDDSPSLDCSIYDEPTCDARNLLCTKTFSCQSGGAGSCTFPDCADCADQGACDACAGVGNWLFSTCSNNGACSGLNSYGSTTCAEYNGCAWGEGGSPACIGSIIDTSCGQIAYADCSTGTTSSECDVASSNNTITHIDQAGVGQTESTYICRDSSGNNVTTIDYTCGVFTTPTGNFVDISVSGNVVGNLNVTGNATINNYYGGMWNYTDTGYLITLGGVGQAKNLTNFTADMSNGFNVINSRSLNVTTSDAYGTYKLDYSVSFQGGATGTYDWDITINGVVIEKCRSHQSGGGALTENNVASGCFVTINATRNYINLQVHDDTNPVSNPTIYASNVRLRREGN